MMKKYFLIALIFSGLMPLSAQSYRVYFTDKGQQEQLLEQPELLLSEAALIRRAAQGIALDQSDLPVYAPYLKTLKRMGGQILAQSRWLNYAYVQGLSADEIQALPFVKKVEQPKAHVSHLATTATSTTFDYGLGRTQIEMLNGHKLHQQGFTGRGVNIAVIDAGFTGVWQASVLDSLRQSGRLLGSYNFVTSDTNVYSGQGGHGASVLSVMAALDTGVFVGTAPHANYWLLTSENVHSETPLEMDHWLMAAEFADSVGAHVINTSLGYTTFDDTADSYSYSDMDGNTTVVTRAADWAASKGIIVVASAGNEGGGSWQHIGAPADGDSVLAVGAVDGTGAYVGFSSRGPSYDWRIKPDVVAMGAGTTLINIIGDISAGNGTSFSSPCIAGMAACVVQGQPTLAGQTIANNIRFSGHLYGNANNNLGFGIPDFLNAWRIGIEELEASQNSLQVYPNPVAEALFVYGDFEYGTRISFKVLNQAAQILKEEERTWQNQSERIELSGLAPGIYYLQIAGKETYIRKILVK
jgi:hypothetical protein